MKRQNKLILDNYFSRYKKIEDEIFISEQNYQVLLYKKTSISIANYNDNSQKSTIKKGIDDVLAELEKKEKHLQALYQSKEEIKQLYLADFKKLENSLYFVILSQYYLEHLLLKEIAVNTNRSIDDLKHKKTEALDKLIELIKTSVISSKNT